MRRYYGTDEATGQKNILLWVAPGAVCYDIEDIEFLLPWLHEMREGAYPIEPSGYVGTKVQGKTRAYYESACQVAAELDNRLSHTGLDRYLIEDNYCRGIDEYQLTRDLGMDIREVRRRLRSAVSYIASGECPRWINCIDCSGYQKCSRRHRPPVKFRKQIVGITYKEWKARKLKKSQSAKTLDKTGSRLYNAGLE